MEATTVEEAAGSGSIDGSTSNRAGANGGAGSLGIGGSGGNSTYSSGVPGYHAYPGGGGGGGSSYTGNLINPGVKAGNTTFTAPSGSSETGHTGNGYARITFVNE